MTAMMQPEAGGLRVVARDNPFSSRTTQHTAREGATLAALLAEAVPDRALHPFARITLNDDAQTGEPAEVPRALWHRVRPKAGSLVQIVLLPQGGGGGGGKDALRIVLQVAIIAAAFFLGPMVGGAVLSGLGVPVGNGIMIAGMASQTFANALGGFLIPCCGPLILAAHPPTPEANP